MEIEKYIKSLKPIKNLECLSIGTRIFNKCSLDVSFIDTFIAYDKERDIITYKNCKGETWSGKGKDYWFLCNNDNVI